MKKYLVAAVVALVTQTPAFAASTTVKVDLNNDAIAVSPATIPAGKVSFQVDNASMDEAHEMVVLKAPAGDVPYDQKVDRVIEAQLKSMGEISKLKEGASGRLEANLAPGSYILICNYKGHYRHGMHAALTVQ